MPTKSAGRETGEHQGAAFRTSALAALRSLGFILRCSIALAIEPRNAKARLDNGARHRREGRSVGRRRGSIGGLALQSVDPPDLIQDLIRGEDGWLFDIVNMYQGRSAATPSRPRA
jgi:hypothetical protein